MFGRAKPATIERKPGAITMGQTASWQTVYAVTVREFLGTVFQPISSAQVTHAYGVTGDLYMPCQVDMDWPDTTDPQPVRVGDRLTYHGISYPIKGVKPYPGDHIELCVEVPAP